MSAAAAAPAVRTDTLTQLVYNIDDGLCVS